MYFSFWFLVKIRRPSAEDVREAAEALALTASAAPPLPPLINQNTPIQSELLTSPALPGSILGGDSQPSQSSPSTTAKDPTLSIYPLKKEPKSANSNYTSSFVKSLADHVDAAIAGDTTYYETFCSVLCKSHIGGDDHHFWLTPDWESLWKALSYESIRFGLEPS